MEMEGTLCDLSQEKRVTCFHLPRDGESSIRVPQSQSRPRFSPTSMFEFLAEVAERYATSWIDKVSTRFVSEHPR